MTREWTELRVEIPPVEAGARPTWSIMIPSYNCVRFLPTALESVLLQDLGEDVMEIEVIDDCSTIGNVAEVVESVAGERVRVWRNTTNLGVTGTFNTCLQRSRGSLVHILHCDDYVLPGFYEALTVGFEEPSIGACFCRSKTIDDKGVPIGVSELERAGPGPLQNWLERIAVSCRLTTPSIVVRRSVYEQLGGFHAQLEHSADWEMWRRIAANYRFWYEPRALACWRWHRDNDTSRLLTTGENVADSRRSVAIARAYLPKRTERRLTAQALAYMATYAMRDGLMLLELGYRRAAFAQLWQSARCAGSPLSTILALLRIALVLGMRKALGNRGRTNAAMR